MICILCVCSEGEGELPWARECEGLCPPAPATEPVESSPKHVSEERGGVHVPHPLHVLQVLPRVVHTPLPLVREDLVGLTDLLEDLLLLLPHLWLS